MEMILIPLAKGFLGLMGASTFYLMSFQRDMEVQLKAMELELEELEQLEVQPQLELKIEPEKK